MAEPTPSVPETIRRLQDAVPPALAMLAGMQLEVFTALAEGPRTAAEIAQSLGLAEDRLSRLLHALVLTGLLDHDDGRFANSAEAQTFLVKGRPGYIGGSHELTSDIWHADLHTADSIRLRAPAALHDFSAMHDEALSAFLRGLVPSASETGRQLAAMFDFSTSTSVVDVGGGSGAVLVPILQKYPSMRGTLFELPGMARAAMPILGQLPCSDRIDVDTGDILAGAPKGTHDIAIMRALVQVLSRADAAVAIANTARCLRPGGRLYITGSGIVQDDRLSPASGVYLNLTLMNFYPHGEAYTISEHYRLLEQAGCVEPSHATMPSGSTLIWAVKAE
jgi:hypothetical protein